MTEPIPARIYQLMVLTAWADGHLHPDEQFVAGKVLHESERLQDFGDREALARAARELLDRDGVRGAVSALASGIDDPHDRTLAVVCCARVLAADGILARGEFVVISELRRLFGLSVEEVDRLLARVH